MFGGGGFGGGGSGEALGRQSHRSSAPTAAGGHPTGSTAHQNHAADREALPAAYFGQPTSYQQWLPAQFAQFALGGPYVPSPTPNGGAAVFYAPPPGHAHLAAPGGGAGGSGSAEQQAFMAAHAHLPLPMGLPPEAAAPRGWGGMQLHEQQQRGGHGGARWGTGRRAVCGAAAG